MTELLCHRDAYLIPDLIRTRINLLPEGIREVGTIKVAGYDSKGKINKRIKLEIAD